MGFSIWQLLIVLLIVILLFGTKKLKNIGGDLGGALKNFKDAVKDQEKADEEKQSPTVEKQDAEFSENIESTEKTSEDQSPTDRS